MRNNFYGLIICVVTLLLLSGCSSSSTNASDKTLNDTVGLDLSCLDCNVLFLNIELLRADYVGLISPEHNVTPNIDKFFENAIIFEDVSSASGVTGISNPATLTSRDGMFTRNFWTNIFREYTVYRNTYSDWDSANIPEESIKIVSQIPTIAQTLKNNGYNTIYIYEDDEGGRRKLLDRGIDKYFGDTALQAEDPYAGRALRKTQQMLEEEAKNGAINKNAKHSKQKFLLIVRPNDLHAPPYNYPANRSRIEDPRITYIYNNKSNTYEVIYGSTYETHINEKVVINQSIIEEYRSLGSEVYMQQLKYVDEELGILFKYLEDSALLENTIIVLYANHGDGLYDNGVPNHGVVYQSCVHVPLLILHPKIDRQIRIKQSISLLDLVPTIYSMVEINNSNETIKNLDGISLVNVIKGEKYEREYIYGVDAQSKYVRQGELKLVVWSSNNMELYNISVDPHEERNIIEVYPEKADELYKTLTDHEMLEISKAQNSMNIS